MKFYNTVYPALRENRRNVLAPDSEVAVQDEDDGEFVPPQSSQSGDVSGPSDMRWTDIHLGSLAEPDDHPLASGEEYDMLPAPRGTETSEPVVSDRILQTHVPGIGDIAASTNEIEEVLSTSESYEEPRTAELKDEAVN